MEAADFVEDIHHATQGCVSSLQDCLTVKPLLKGDWAESRLADINLWASNVGALAMSEVSLDRRLQFQPKVRLVLTSLLFTLKELAKSCRMRAWELMHGQPVQEIATSESNFTGMADANLASTMGDDVFHKSSSTLWFDSLGSDSRSGSESSIDNKIADRVEADQLDSGAGMRTAMRDVEDMLDQIIMLGLVIRKSGSAARLRKADTSFDPKTYEDLRTHLEFILIQYASAGETAEDTVATFENRMKEGPGTTTEQRHLILANLRRRHLFQYARRHQEKLQKPMSRVGKAQQESKIPTYPVSELSSQSGPSQWLNMEIQSTHPPRKPPASSLSQVSFREPEMSINKASTAESDIFNMPRPSSTTASRASLTVATMQYPSPPPTTRQMKGFRCPCCYQILPIMFQDISRWRKHLAEDLCPYTCPLPECPRKDVLYTSRNVWRDHVLASHGAGQCWDCLACAGAGIPEHFLTVSAFIDHTKGHHKDIVTEDQLTSFANLCCRIAAPIIPRCPLCPWPQGEETTPDAASNLEHIGNCIHEFSLRALPWAVAEDPEPTGSSSPSQKLVREWMHNLIGEEDAVEVGTIDINSFRFLEDPQVLNAEIRPYIPGEYFAEASNASFGEEEELPMSNADLPEVSVTHSDDMRSDQPNDAPGSAKFGHTEHKISGAVADLDEAVESTEQAVFVRLTSLTTRPPVTVSHEGQVQVGSLAPFQVHIHLIANLLELADFVNIPEDNSSKTREPHMYYIPLSVRLVVINGFFHCGPLREEPYPFLALFLTEAS